MSPDPFEQILLRAGVINPAAPRPTRPTIDLPTAAAGDSAAAKYAEAALSKEVEIVCAAPEGRRNELLNQAAFNMGQLVAAGHIDGIKVLDALTMAAQIAGLDLPEIEKTAPRAASDGGAKPRVVKLDPPVQPAFTLIPGGATDDTTPPEDTLASKFKPGGQWIFSTPATPPLVWGTGQQALWVEGESLIITGPPGVGKSTIAQQLIMARIGLATQFLGLDVTPTGSRVLYLAMDRPRQIARSIRRMVEETDQPLLDDRLVIWQGPLPFDINIAPTTFAVLAEKAGADTIVVDSVKDTSVGLVESKGAGVYNRARQIALSAGVQMVEIAHQTKRGSGDRAPKSLADVHGGMELTAGAGSVALVWGEAGDPVVEMRHLKQPMETLGPWTLVHDGIHGRTTIEERLDAYRMLQDNPSQAFTVAQVAERLTDAGKVTKADVERARRQLERLAADGVAASSTMVTANGGKPEKRYQWSDFGARSTTWNGD